MPTRKIIDFITNVVRAAVNGNTNLQCILWSFGEYFYILIFSIGKCYVRGVALAPRAAHERPTIGCFGASTLSLLDWFRMQVLWLLGLRLADGHSLLCTLAHGSMHAPCSLSSTPFPSFSCMIFYWMVLVGKNILSSSYHLRRFKWLRYCILRDESNKTRPYLHIFWWYYVN